MLGRLHLAATFAALAITSACGGDPSPGKPAESESRQRALASLVERVIVPNYDSFAERAGALTTAVRAWQTSPDETTLAAARSAWTAAFEAWQHAELHSVGPSGMNNAVAGGMDLREEIYAWPLINRCRIDQETTETAYTSEDALAAEAVNVRGLGALEYLLFSEGTGNACPANASLNTSGAWSALGESGVRERRRVYAATAAALVERAADTLKTAWAEAGGGFAASLAGAGSTSSVYATSQAGLNAISDAMLYFESAVKDMKLAAPGGLSTACAVDTCPDKLEASLSRTSKAAVLANIRSLRQLLAGGSGDGAFGFYDLLNERGASALSAQLAADLDAAEAAVTAVPGSFEEALAPGNTAGKAAFTAAYDAVKRITDELKTEFLTVLDLSLPQRLESDND